MSEETVLPWFEGERRSWPPLEELRAQRDAARRERDELRSVLAPLLEKPRRWVDGPCVFCGHEVAPHDPCCAVLRRAHLLGEQEAS